MCQEKKNPKMSIISVLPFFNGYSQVFFFLESSELKKNNNNNLKNNCKGKKTNFGRKKKIIWSFMSEY